MMEATVTCDTVKTSNLARVQPDSRLNAVGWALDVQLG